MSQADTFLNGEGNAWLKRNRDELGKNDPVTEILSQCEYIKPKRIFEIGCSNGWRLLRLGDLYHLPKKNLCGVDPSSDAHEEAAKNGLYIDYGTAREITYPDNFFDLVIFGFCLYLVDRRDLFSVIAEADRILQDGGYLVILDFFTPPTPYKVKYKYKDGIWSYHQDYPKLFLASPTYKTVVSYASTLDSGPEVLVSVLHKKIDLAYPEGEP